MRPLRWVTKSPLKEIRSWPEAVREEVFDELAELQRGHMPREYEAVKGLTTTHGKVFEFKLKTRVGDSSTYRVFYVIAYKDAIYVLHAAKKKSNKIRSEDMETLKARYKTMIIQRDSQ